MYISGARKSVQSRGPATRAPRDHDSEKNTRTSFTRLFHRARRLPRPRKAIIAVTIGHANRRAIKTIRKISEAMRDSQRHAANFRFLARAYNRTTLIPNVS